MCKSLCLNAYLTPNNSDLNGQKRIKNDFCRDQRFNGKTISYFGHACPKWEIREFRLYISLNW